MKTWKRLMPIIIWTFLVVTGLLYLSLHYSSNRYGEDINTAWGIAKSMYTGSGLFWCVAFFLVAQTVVLMAKPIKHRVQIEILLLVMVITVLFALFKEFSNSIASYQAVVSATAPTDQELTVAMIITRFKKDALIYTVISAVASALNTIIAFTENSNSPK